MIKKTILTITLLLHSICSFAGSPGGLYLLVVPMNSAIKYKPNIDAYFNKYYGTDNPLSPSCKINIGKKERSVKTQVDLFYLTRKPKDITNTLLSNALIKSTERNRLKHIARNYKDDLVDSFDAIVFYESTDTEINFYSLSVINKETKLAKSTLTIDWLQEDEKLGQALCQVIAYLPLPAP